MPAMKKYLRLLGPVLVLLIFCGAVWLLCVQLTGDDLQRIMDRLQDLFSTSAGSIVVAIGLTAANYILLIGYDFLAVRYIGEKLPLRRIALASFAGYTCGYNFGSTLAGTSVRYRLYSAWGVPPVKILHLLVILGLTFWFGLFALAGVVFIIAPLPMPEILRDYLHFDTTQPFGFVLLAAVAIYLGLAAWHGGSVRILRWQLPTPPFKLSLYQVAIASADLLLVAGVLYALWPPEDPTGYLRVLGIYMLVFVAGVLTHVPGGYGVMEAVLAAFILRPCRQGRGARLLAGVPHHLLPVAAVDRRRVAGLVRAPLERAASAPSSGRSAG